MTFSRTYNSDILATTQIPFAYSYRTDATYNLYSGWRWMRFSSNNPFNAI